MLIGHYTKNISEHSFLCYWLAQHILSVLIYWHLRSVFMVNVQSVGLTLRPNRTNWFVFFFSRHLLLVKKNEDKLLLSVFVLCIWNTYVILSLSAGSDCDCSLLYASVGRIGSSSHPSPAAGEHWAGEPAEKTGEFFQHFCRGVQPEPAASSPRSDGSWVPPSIL